MPTEVHGTITTLKDSSGNVKFPITISSAININGETLDDKLNELELQKYYYNVKNYGIIGDDITDDTIAIQNLINNIGSNGGGVIYFPNGEYKFTETLKITHSNITIKGETNSILKYHGRGQGINFIHIYGTWKDKAYLENVILDGITLDCTNQEFKGGASEDDLSLTSPKPLGGAQNGIFMQYAYNSKIINCRFKDIYGNGMYLNRCSFCTVDHCFLEDCSGSRMGDMPYDYMGDGIGASMSFAIMISNNKVINRRTFKVHNEAGEMSLTCDVYGKQCARSGLEFEYPVNMDLWGSPERWGPFATLRNNTEGYDLVFKNNYVYGYNKGIHLENGVNALVDGNTIINCNIGLIDATGGATQIINNEFDSNNVGKSPQGGYDWYYGSIVLPHFLGTTFNNPVINGNRFYGDADGICFGRSYIDIINNDFRNSGVYIKQRGDDRNNINITGNKFLAKDTLANDDTSKAKLELYTLNNSKITNNTFLSENYYMILNASLIKCIISDNLFKNARFDLFYSNNYNIFNNNICKETLMSKDTKNGYMFNIFPASSSIISNNIFESTGWCCMAGGDYNVEIKDNRYFIGRLMNDYSLHLFRNRCKFINNEIIFNTDTLVSNLFHSNNTSPKFDSYIVIKNNRIITLDKITKDFKWLDYWDSNNFQQVIVENNIPNIKSKHENKPTYGYYYSLNDIVDKNAYNGTYYKCIKQGWYSGESWESGIVYDVKRPLKNNSNNVYICKKVPKDDSNNPIASTIEPTFTTNKDVTLDDGYVWYYLGECAEFKIYDANNNEITQ